MRGFGLRQSVLDRRPGGVRLCQGAGQFGLAPIPLRRCRGEVRLQSRRVCSSVAAASVNWRSRAAVCSTAASYCARTSASRVVSAASFRGMLPGGLMARRLAGGQARFERGAPGDFEPESMLERSVSLGRGGEIRGRTRVRVSMGGFGLRQSVLDSVRAACASASDVQSRRVCSSVAAASVNWRSRRRSARPPRRTARGRQRAGWSGPSLPWHAAGLPHGARSRRRPGALRAWRARRFRDRVAASVSLRGEVAAARACRLMGGLGLRRRHRSGPRSARRSPRRSHCAVAAAAPTQSSRSALPPPPSRRRFRGMLPGGLMARGLAGGQVRFERGAPGDFETESILERSVSLGRGREIRGRARVRVLMGGLGLRQSVLDRGPGRVRFCQGCGQFGLAPIPLRSCRGGAPTSSRVGSARALPPPPSIGVRRRRSARPPRRTARTSASRVVRAVTSVACCRAASWRAVSPAARRASSVARPAISRPSRFSSVACCSTAAASSDVQSRRVCSSVAAASVNWRSTAAVCSTAASYCAGVSEPGDAGPPHGSAARRQARSGWRARRRDRVDSRA